MLGPQQPEKSACIFPSGVHPPGPDPARVPAEPWAPSSRSCPPLLNQTETSRSCRPLALECSPLSPRTHLCPWNALSTNLCAGSVPAQLQAPAQTCRSDILRSPSRLPGVRRDLRNAGLWHSAVLLPDEEGAHCIGGSWPRGRRAQAISAGNHDHVSETSRKGAAPIGAILFYFVQGRLAGSLTCPGSQAGRAFRSIGFLVHVRGGHQEEGGDPRCMVKVLSSAYHILSHAGPWSFKVVMRTSREKAWALQREWEARVPVQDSVRGL